MAHIVVLVAPRQATTLTPAAAARALAACEGFGLTWLSPGESAEFTAPAAPDLAALRTLLPGVDVLAVPSRGRRKAVLVADMDSTIVTTETLDELADQAGLKAQIASITRRSMNGELDFASALRERVALLRGLELAALERTWAGTALMPGAKTLVATMNRFGATTALVSGGFTWFTARVAAAVGFSTHRANVLRDDGAALTGEVEEPILGREAKLAALTELAEARGVKLGATLAVGDGANDLAMLRAAGLGIAYHAKPVVTAEIANQLHHADLRALLFAQGYPASAFVEG